MDDPIGSIRKLEPKSVSHADKTVSAAAPLQPNGDEIILFEITEAVGPGRDSFVTRSHGRMDAVGDMDTVEPYIRLRVHRHIHGRRNQIRPGILSLTNAPR